MIFIMGKTIDLDKARAAKDAQNALAMKIEMKKKRLRGLKLFLIGAACIFAALTFITQSQRMAELKEEEKKLNQHLLELENTTQRLERMIQYSQTDSYIEAMAVKLFGMVKPGDILFYADPEANGEIAMQTVPENFPTAEDSATPETSQTPETTPPPE